MPPTLSPQIVRNIRLLEWMFLTIHLLLEASSSGHSRLLLAVALYAVFFSLSFYFPDRNPVLGRVYLYSGLGLAIAANTIGVSTDFLLYLYIGKSCFFVNVFINRTELLSLLFFSGCGWVWSEIYSNVSATGEMVFNPPYGFVRSTVPSVLSASLGIYIGASIFIIFLCAIIAAEQKSRRRAEELVQQVEALAKDLERTRIARTIHDSLGHTLTGLNIQLQLAQKLEKTDPKQAFLAVNLAKVLSVQCIEDVSYALGYIRQTDFDLDAAIARLIHQLQQNVSIVASVDMPPLSIPLSMRHQIYMILKECLINVQKHSKASQVRLKGQITQLGLSLDLEDNGVGFVYQQPSTGFGLQGVVERIQMLGGQFNIQSELGRGTLIQIEIPL